VKIQSLAVTQKLDEGGCGYGMRRDRVEEAIAPGRGRDDDVQALLNRLCERGRGLCRRAFGGDVARFATQADGYAGQLAEACGRARDRRRRNRFESRGVIEIDDESGGTGERREGIERYGVVQTFDRVAHANRRP